MIIFDQNNGQYQVNSTIKFNTEVIKPNFCDYSDAHILVTCNIKITGGNENTKFCFKDTPFTRCVLHLNDTHIETAENLELVMKHYNLIEYSDNYQGTFGSLYQFRRNEQPLSDAGNIAVVTSANSSSFKYKSNFFRGLNSEATVAIFMINQFRTELKKYDELIKVTTRKGEDYTTGCLLDYKYYKDYYSIITCNLSKQKELDSDPRAIKQIEKVFMLNADAQILTILEKSKETILEFSKGTTKKL